MLINVESTSFPIAFLPSLSLIIFLLYFFFNLLFSLSLHCYYQRCSFFTILLRHNHSRLIFSSVRAFALCPTFAALKIARGDDRFRPGTAFGMEVKNHQETQCAKH